MRIAVNTRVLLKGRMEGVCRYIHETTKRMVLKHPEHEFFFFFDRPFHPSFIYASNVTPVVLSPPTRDPILWKVWFEYVVPRALKKYKIDVFLSGDTFLSLRTEVPTLLVSHDIAYEHFPDHLPSRVLKYYQKYFPLFHSKAAHIIAVSAFTKKDIVDTYGIDPSKISVAYNATPDGFYPFTAEEKELVKSQFTSGQPFFIYVGSIHPRKNVGNLIRGFLQFKKNNHRHKLIILGRKAWNFKEYETLMEQSNDIIFLDGNTYDPRNIVPASDALIYISLHEGFGIPILEGMSAGVPVITSDVSSMPEVAGNAGILIDPRSLDAIEGALKDVASNDQSSIIKRGFKRLDSFNWDNSAEIIFDKLIEISK
jgi:glycosyltransferase involved in cell wall biosynthesis